MGILVVGGVIFGMILGQFFKWFVLIPACGLAIVLVSINPTHMANSFLGWVVQFIVLTTSLQIGYVVGLAAHTLRLRASKLSQNPGVPRRDGTLSAVTKTHETGRRAA